MSLHGKRKEIYKYEAPWTVYAMNWSVRPDKRFRLALGSFVEEYNNKVGIFPSVPRAGRAAGSCWRGWDWGGGRPVLLLTPVCAVVIQRDRKLTAWSGVCAYIGCVGLC